MVLVHNYLKGTRPCCLLCHCCACCAKCAAGVPGVPLVCLMCLWCAGSEAGGTMASRGTWTPSSTSLTSEKKVRAALYSTVQYSAVQYSTVCLCILRQPVCKLQLVALYTGVLCTLRNVMQATGSLMPHCLLQ